MKIYMYVIKFKIYCQITACNISSFVDRKNTDVSVISLYED